MTADVMKAIHLLLLAATASQAAPVYQLHEWGTFTTVSGSDGVLLPGLQREEEQLPDFVHSHIGMENGQSPDPAEIQRIYLQHGTAGINPPFSKGLGERPLLGVTVKMETPVIYFHSEETAPFQAKVKVGFEGGTISQWYPERSGGETLPEPPPSPDPLKKPTPLAAWTLDFSKPYRGGIEWDVQVLPPAGSRDLVLFKPGDDLGWLRARQPMTNALRSAKGEQEGYLFYRGVGNFDPGLKTTVDAEGTLRLENHTGGKIPYLVVFDTDGRVARWSQSEGGLEAGASGEFKEANLKAEGTGFPEPLYVAMKNGLSKCGLTDAEARSMVETWWKSYFQAPGLRVFWVLPRETTDRILPLEVSPAPAEIVRVIVGRSEILKPRQEQEWLTESRWPAEQAKGWSYLVSNDRFGLAIKERIKALEEKKATGKNPSQPEASPDNDDSTRSLSKAIR